MKIIYRWTALLLVGFSAILAIFSVYVYHREVSQFDQDTLSDLRRIGDVLRRHIVGELKTGSLVEVRSLVRDADRALPNLVVRLVSTSTSPVLDRAERSRLLRGAAVVHHEDHHQLSGRTDLYLPIVVHGKRPIAVMLSQSSSRQVRYTRHTQLSILAAAIAVLVISTLLALLLSNHVVGKPIAELVQRFRRIGSGDLSLATTDRRDEFGRLGRAVNEMCQMLAESEAKIQRENEGRLMAVEQARQADRLATVGRLASGVAHELGTPLNVVTGLATEIVRGEYDPEEIPQTAETIAAQARRMTRIVHDVLRFSRRHKAIRRQANLRGLVRDAIGLLETLARKSGVSVELAPGPEYMAEVDEEQMTQVLVNLVQNAIQAQRPGGAVTVSLAPETMQSPTVPTGQEADWIRIVVADRGPGMSPEVMEQIFDPFFTTKEVGTGTGLGLSVVKGIVQEHDGWVAVSSELGKGSQFSVYVPHTRPTAAT